VTARKYTEAEVAAVVVGYLDARGYDVYQEVELRAGGIRADIVAKLGPEITIVETKTSASLALLYQAMERRRFAHRIYIAVPVPAHDMIQVCEELGIGVLRVRINPEHEQRWNPTRCDEELVSRRWNTRPVKLADRLRPEHKTSAAAGSQTGGHWSRWRDTCAQIERLARAQPGISLREAIAQVQHHYASRRGAVSTMGTHIRLGRVAGVKIEGGALWPLEVT
jgi:hypothetical protein